MMNANLFDLARDAWFMMRMRYRPKPEMYRYGTVVFVAVLLAIGLVNVLNMQPIFGRSAGAMGFGILTGITRFVVLARSSREILRDSKTGARLPWLGYVLAGEALMLPSLFVFILPELAMPLSIWLLWAFWVQAMGFVVQSGHQPRKVVIMYLVYWLASVLLIGLFFTLFLSVGWLDAAEIAHNLQHFLEAANQQQ